MRNFTEPDNDRSAGQLCQFILEVEIALANFIGSRFVLRWQAFNGIGYAAIVEFQAIIARCRLRPVAVTELEKRPIKQDTGKIAGKRASRGIGAVHARREPDNQQLPHGVAEGGDRSAMIIGIFLAGLYEERG
jgi:hypothetical protein